MSSALIPIQFVNRKRGRVAQLNATNPHRREGEYRRENARRPFSRSFPLRRREFLTVYICCSFFFSFFLLLLFRIVLYFLLVLLSAYVRPFFLLLLILSNLGGECVPTGKLCERFVVGLLLIRPLPSSSVRLLLAPPSSFHFLPVFPHICYVDRQVTTLTAPPSGTPIFSLFHSLSFFVSLLHLWKLKIRTSG